ncbi:MAG: tRNA (adenosine(37)-N6)-threonylcarbamoyltransferase complex dimerization subunit type 1 TsaB [Pyrinomonadaceae bacterium]
MTIDSEPFILAVETALRQKMSVSVLRNSGKVSSWSGDDSRMTGSAVLLQAISTLIEENCLLLGDLEIIAVSQGPGSFTGIRVGLATVKALAFGLNRPYICIPTLEALALTTARSERIFAVIPAGKNQVYWQFFSDLESEDLIRQGKPNLDGFEDFIERLKFLLNTISSPSDELTIVADEMTAAEIKNSFGLAVDKIENLNIEIASDNVSEYIGLKVRKLFREGQI